MSGREQKHWTDGEVDALLEMAGGMPVASIAAELGRTVCSVQIKASRLGVSLDMSAAVWCPSCSTWRTGLDSNGRCPACRMRSLADAMEARWRNETPPDAVSQPAPAPVAKRPPLAVVRAEEAAAVERHRARYNAAKMRLSRARRSGGA